MGGLLSSHRSEATTIPPDEILRKAESFRSEASQLMSQGKSLLEAISRWIQVGMSIPGESLVNREDASLSAGHRTQSTSCSVILRAFQSRSYEVILSTCTGSTWPKPWHISNRGSINAVWETSSVSRWSPEWEIILQTTSRRSNPKWRNSSRNINWKRCHAVARSS